MTLMPDEKRVTPQPAPGIIDAVETEVASLRNVEPAPPSAEQRVYLIVGLQGAHRVLELDKDGAVTFGRSLGDATVAIDDPLISRMHARIRRQGGEVYVEDLGSRNGTRVGGVLLESASRRVTGGEVIRFGSAEITVATSTSRASQAPRSAVTDDVDAPNAPDRSPRIVVADAKMQRVFHIARRLGLTQTTVLLLGETGVGKEVVAEEIHRSSDRARRRFVRLNCATLPEHLVESELFGHERGAFTGADRRRVGYFEAAQGGTLLLDEIGELSPRMQAKLLLVLENRVVTRLGGTHEIPVDVRLICATHRDLEREIPLGGFREDLWYRISAFTLPVPPLRERPAEIEMLANIFAREFGTRAGGPAPEIDDAAMAALTRHAWPGNVRELRNAIEYAVVLAEDGTIRTEHLPPTLMAPAQAPGGSVAAGPLKTEIAGTEKRNIEAALAAEDGNQTKAARRLGISRRALIYKMAKYKIAQ
jgi:transcriptional regulator with PAS, ATPase and Fis domain